MNLYLLLLNLAGSVTLLLWAVRMVRTGVERGHAVALRRVLRDSRGGSVGAAGIGTMLAVVLQSATAVALLAAGFAGAGLLSVGRGLAIMLGADVGSALVVQILAVDLRWFVPVLLLAGGGLFFKGTTREQRQGGRVLIGIALILISLKMVGEATAPLRQADLLPAIVDYLRGDFVTAFLLGALFTWLVHSSVASILLIATFAAQGLVPFELGVSLVLGANLGGGLIALGLTRASFLEARQIVTGNLLFRGSGALVAILAFHLYQPSMEWLGASPARQLINFHLAFNLALLCLCLPWVSVAEKLVRRLVKPGVTPADLNNPLGDAASALDKSVVGMPALALASATRELLRMAELIERMLQPLMELYETGDPEMIRQARRLESAVNQAQSEIKLYLATIDCTDEEDERRVQELSRFAINLEHVGDAISKTLMKLVKTRRDQKLRFSPAGWQELNELHDRVMVNMRLSLNVLVSRDRDSARQLIEEKEAMASAERASYGQHLRRLRSGTSTSIATSDIHLETVRTLKTINSLFASVAYPILRESGDLVGSRLMTRP